MLKSPRLTVLSMNKQFNYLFWYTNQVWNKIKGKEMRKESRGEQNKDLLVNSNLLLLEIKVRLREGMTFQKQKNYI